MFTIDELKSRFPHSGKIEWIGLRKSESKEIVPVQSAELLQNYGIAGDKAAQKQGGKRQVTLIQAEYFTVLQSFIKRDQILPEDLRRNIVVSGVNLNILHNSRLHIKNTIIEITGNCAPCFKMEKILGYGGYNAMRNHGGVSAIVIKGGIINVGDEVKVNPDLYSKNSHQKKLI